MRIKITVVLIVLAVLTSVFTGCSPNQENYLIEILKILPDDIIEVEYTGVELMAEDPELVDIYHELIESFYGAWVYLLGLDFYDIHAIVGTSGLVIIKGDFDFQNVRDALSEFPEHEFVQDEYEGVEFWIGDPDSDEPLGIVFLEKLLVFGDVDYVKDTVRVSQKTEPSLYDNEDIKSVADRLPSGIHVEIYTGEVVGDIPVLAGGRVLFNSVQGDEIINSQGWYRFESTADAQAALPDLEDSYQWQYTHNIDAQLKGEFVEITGESMISIYTIPVS